MLEGIAWGRADRNVCPYPNNAGRVGRRGGRMAAWRRCDPTWAGRGWHPAPTQTMRGERCNWKTVWKGGGVHPASGGAPAPHVRGDCGGSGRTRMSAPPRIYDSVGQTLLSVHFVCPRGRGGSVGEAAAGVAGLFEWPRGGAPRLEVIIEQNPAPRPGDQTPKRRCERAAGAQSMNGP